MLGSRTVPLLVFDGHEIAVMTRFAETVEAIRSAGAKPTTYDILGFDTLDSAISAFRPEVIFHELTDLPNDRSLLDDLKSSKSRIRREGTRNLLASPRVAKGQLGSSWRLWESGGRVREDGVCGRRRGTSLRPTLHTR